MLEAIRVLKEKQAHFEREWAWDHAPVRDGKLQAYGAAIRVLEEAMESEVDDMAESYGEE